MILFEDRLELISKCVNSCAVTAGGATGVECPVEEFITQPVFIPGGAASPTTWLLLTHNAATSAIVTDGDTIPAAGETSVAPPILSSNGASSSAEVVACDSISIVIINTVSSIQQPL